MSARITLDKNAMEVILDTFPEEMRVDFSNKVLKAVSERMLNDRHESALSQHAHNYLQGLMEETVKRSGLFDMKLTDHQKTQLRKAMDDAIAHERERAKTECYAIVRESRERVQEMVDEKLNRHIERYLNNVIDRLVRESIARQLDNLMTLGESLKLAPPGESKGDQQ